MNKVQIDRIGRVYKCYELRHRQQRVMDAVVESLPGDVRWQQQPWQLSSLLLPNDPGRPSSNYRQDDKYTMPGYALLRSRFQTHQRLLGTSWTKSLNIRQSQEQIRFLDLTARNLANHWLFVK
ncbi:MAG: hypothetical protein QGG71_10860 [Pirellulaceae bacterium]|nr:hypothetical protein [Pirellulaceae bacterium]